MVTTADLNRYNRDGLGLPAPAPTGLWATIADSPAVVALRSQVLPGYLDLAQPVAPDTPMDIRAYVAAATQPIANLREELELFGFPSGGYLGEDFERRVGANKLQYFQRRNTASLLVELAAHAEFRYILSWQLTAGERTAMNVLVTPSRLLGEATEFGDFVTEWLIWSYPWFGAGGVTVTLAPEVRLGYEAAIAMMPVYQGVVDYA